ncbi:MAG: DNA repair protein RadC [Methylococcaceae bacterium]
MNRGNKAQLLSESGSVINRINSVLYTKSHSGEFIPAEHRDIIAEAKRIYSYSIRKGQKIDNSSQASDAIQSRLRDKHHEVFACLYLDSQHRIIAFEELFRGTIDGAVVHPREVVKEAIALNAKAVIFAHNHPSGDPEPSQHDIQITEKLKSVLALVDIMVLDHLVIGDSVVSLSERGLI